jgi:hypothetical protein
MASSFIDADGHIIDSVERVQAGGRGDGGRLVHGVDGGGGFGDGGGGSAPHAFKPTTLTTMEQIASSRHAAATERARRRAHVERVRAGEAQRRAKSNNNGVGGVGQRRSMQPSLRNSTKLQVRSAKVISFQTFRVPTCTQYN